LDWRCQRTQKWIDLSYCNPSTVTSENAKHKESVVIQRAMQKQRKLLQLYCSYLVENETKDEMRKTIFEESEME
jgi:hypothetical protein